MIWLGIRKPSPDEAFDRERARERLRNQEQRVQALDRAVEVISRQLSTDQQQRQDRPDVGQ